MKLIKSLLVVACVVAISASVSMAAEKEAKKQTCCEKAKAKGETCKHDCCVTAAKDGKTCEKCNPKKDDKK